MEAGRARVLVPVVLLLLVAVVLVADKVVEAVAEQRAAERISDEIGADTEVDLVGWPVGLRLLFATVPRADVTARQVPLEDLTTDLDRLDVTVEDVRLRWRDLRVGGPVPEAARGRFEARLTAESAFALADVPGSLLGFTIHSDAVHIRVVGQEVPADLQVTDGRLHVVPQGLPFASLLAGEAAVDISDQPGSPRIEEAVIEGDVLVVRGPVQELRA